MKRLPLVLSVLVLFSSCVSMQHMTKDSKNLLIAEFELIAENYFPSFNGTYTDGVTLKFANSDSKKEYTVVTRSASGFVYVENLPAGLYQFTELILNRQRIGATSDLHQRLGANFGWFIVKDGVVNNYGRIAIKWTKNSGGSYSNVVPAHDEIKEHFAIAAPQSEYLGWDWIDARPK